MNSSENVENSAGLFMVSGLDMWGGDFSERKVSNLDEAIQVAKEWVTNETKCATYWEVNQTVYLKYVEKCNPSKTFVEHHKECTSFFKGKRI